MVKNCGRTAYFGISSLKMLKERAHKVFELKDDMTGQPTRLTFYPRITFEPCPGIGTKNDSD